MILYNATRDEYTDATGKQAMLMVLSGDWIQLHKNAKLSYFYARDTLERRWPSCEAAIAGDPEWAYLYAYNVIGGLWSGPYKQQAEAAIADNPALAYWYARYVIKGRFIKGEATIASNPQINREYQKLLLTL